MRRGESVIVKDREKSFEYKDNQCFVMSAEVGDRTIYYGYICPSGKWGTDDLTAIANNDDIDLDGPLNTRSIYIEGEQHDCFYFQADAKNARAAKKPIRRVIRNTDWLDQQAD